MNSTHSGSRSVLRRLADGRRERMRSGRPVFHLTEAELRSSARVAMRLAGSGGGRHKDGPTPFARATESTRTGDSQ